MDEIDPEFLGGDDERKFRWLYRVFANLETKTRKQEQTIRDLQARLEKADKKILDMNNRLQTLEFRR